MQRLSAKARGGFELAVQAVQLASIAAAALRDIEGGEDCSWITETSRFEMHGSADTWPITKLIRLEQLY
jgi:hypothetical protein